MTPAPIRIEGFVAREANVAVILRRGPAKWTQCLVWDLNRDVVTAGQWIKAKVHTPFCDLSPDGKLFVASFTVYPYIGSPPRPRTGKTPISDWTAVSRPPYFTALSLWSWVDRYRSGGIWLSDRQLALDVYRDDPLDTSGVPRTVSVERIAPSLQGIDRSLLRIERNGWQRVHEIEVVLPTRRSAEPVRLIRESRHERPFAGGRLVRTQDLTHATWRAIDDEDRVRLEFRKEPQIPQWLDLDHRGRIVYADDGCLWVWEGFPEGGPKLVADLRTNVFESVVAPDWATEWPTNEIPEW